MSFPPAVAIQRVFDGSSGGEGYFGGATRRNYTRANTNMLDAKHVMVAGRVVGPPGSTYFHCQWSEGNAMFCLEDSDTAISRPFPSMATGTNQPVTLMNAAQVTFGLQQAAQEMDQEGWYTCPLTVVPPAVGIGVFAVDTPPATLVHQNPESEWYALGLDKELDLAAKTLQSAHVDSLNRRIKKFRGVTEKLKSNSLMRWNNIEHIRRYVRFIGFLSSCCARETRVDVDVATTGNFKVHNYWGASVKVGDYVGFIIKRGTGTCPAYEVSGWSSHDRATPKLKELAFNDLSGNLEFGWFTLAGIVCDVDPLPTYMYDLVQTSQANTEAKGLLGVLGMGKTTIFDALDEATRTARTATRCIVLNVGAKVPAVPDIGLVYKAINSQITAINAIVWLQNTLPSLGITDQPTMKAIFYEWKALEFAQESKDAVIEPHLPLLGSSESGDSSALQYTQGYAEYRFKDLSPHYRGEALKMVQDNKEKYLGIAAIRQIFSAVLQKQKASDPSGEIWQTPKTRVFPFSMPLRPQSGAFQPLASESEPLPSHQASSLVPSGAVPPSAESPTLVAPKKTHAVFRPEVHPASKDINSFLDAIMEFLPTNTAKARMKQKIADDEFYKGLVEKPETITTLIPDDVIDGVLQKIIQSEDFRDYTECKGALNTETSAERLICIFESVTAHRYANVSALVDEMKAWYNIYATAYKLSNEEFITYEKLAIVRSAIQNIPPVFQPILPVDVNDMEIDMTVANVMNGQIDIVDLAQSGSKRFIQNVKMVLEIVNSSVKQFTTAETFPAETATTIFYKQPVIFVARAGDERDGRLSQGDVDNVATDIGFVQFVNWISQWQRRRVIAYKRGRALIDSAKKIQLPKLIQHEKGQGQEKDKETADLITELAKQSPEESKISRFYKRVKTWIWSPSEQQTLTEVTEKIGLVHQATGNITKAIDQLKRAFPGGWKNQLIVHAHKVIATINQERVELDKKTMEISQRPPTENKEQATRTLETLRGVLRDLFINYALFLNQTQELLKMVNDGGGTGSGEPTKTEVSEMESFEKLKNALQKGLLESAKEKVPAAENKPADAAGSVTADSTASADDELVPSSRPSSPELTPRTEAIPSITVAAASRKPSGGRVGRIAKKT